MRHASDSGDRDATVMGDEGSASLEFLVAGLVLLVPVVYLVVSLALIQGQSFGVTAAARDAVHVYAEAGDERTAGRRVDAVLADTAREYGIDPETVSVDVDCVPGDGACPSAGRIIRLTVTARVALPLMPSILSLDEATSVTVDAQALRKLSARWEQ